METQPHPPAGAAPPAPDPLPAAPGEDSADQLLPHFIRAEANLLRLPLFALHTKGLKTLDGIECSGRITRDGQTHQFRFRATRNTATLYPGPLARSAHLAFLSLLTENGLPLQNPLTWSWRDLCRRMHVEYGGWMVRCLKEAIKSTAMLGIQSHYGLYSKQDGQLIHTHDDTLHLYDRVTFVGSPLPDGTTADTNYLWLSDWYLANLNALYSAPLDYGLWRWLDERSPIASRLYEFILVNFYSGVPVLRINYETLVQFLPVRPEQYRSQAKRQLEPALELLAQVRLIDVARWADSKDGLAQLHLYRGPQLAVTASREQAGPPFGDDFPASIHVKELRNLKTAERAVVAEFYRLWTGSEQVRPTPKELAQAAEILAAQGEARAKKLLPIVVERMREQWPDAKTFGATARFLPSAEAELDRRQRQEERRRQEELAEQRDREDSARAAQRRAALQRLWDGLPESDQQAIRASVLASQPRGLQKHPSLLDRLCLDELARRRAPANMDG